MNATDAQPLPSSAQREEMDRAVRRFQRGDNKEASFRLLHEHYHPKVERFLARKVYSTEERLDLTQDVFLRIYTGLEGFRGDGSLDGWVLRITQNVYRKWRDRQPGGKYARPATVRFEDRRDPPALPESLGSPLFELLGRERQQALREGLTELPNRMRQAMSLHLQERSVKEIATALGISPQTAKVHLFQARKKLKQALPGELGETNAEIDAPQSEEPP